MIYAFEVSVHGTEFFSTINSVSLGKAKGEYLRDIRDVWPDVKFTQLRGRKIGPPHTSAAFLRTAKYRGLPNLRCGDPVSVNGRRGFIVGHNDSANFDVLFDEGDWKGCVLNCHPCDFDRRAAHTQESRHAG